MLERVRSLFLSTACLLATAGAVTPQIPTVELLLHGGKVWTGDAANPWAEWVALQGERIAGVGRGVAPRARRSLDLSGRMVVPGFNDSHVHFAQAGRLLLGVNLLDVHDDAGFRARVQEAAARLPAGSWITGGDWGAYEAWGLGSAGTARTEARYEPQRSLIDGVTPDHPVLVTRFDGKLGLANSLALRELGLASETGLLEGEQLSEALRRIPPPSFKRRLAEARRALEECRRWGVTSVQDMSPPEQLEIYRHLRQGRELTCRIHFSPSRLSEYEAMIAKGWVVGAGDEWLRFGTLKTHIDGIMGNRTARFFEPYADNGGDSPAWRGGWREFSEDLRQFEHMLTSADSAGIQLRVHAIGDEANSILLDILERIEARNGARERRARLVHAQVLRAQDFERLGRHALVAEVQPYHCKDDMRWMEERIGHERCKGAYAFRTLLGSGCTLAFGSDWPGTHASWYPVNPLYGLYAAVTRQTLTGKPEGGWFPEERVALEEALRAYTWGGAYASFEEALKGTIEKGKLADLAVLDIDLFVTPPGEWLRGRVDYTIVGGRIVFDRVKDEAERVDGER